MEMFEHATFFADVTFEVGGRTLRAHRNVLSVSFLSCASLTRQRRRCDKVKVMFHSGLREGTPNMEIKILDTTFEV